MELCLARWKMGVWEAGFFGLPIGEESIIIGEV